MDEITQKELKKVLHYDADTGKFTWLKARNSRIKAGDIAGGIDRYGYIRIKINGNKYLAHRLAFLYMTGKFPPDEVDHINHLRADNRFVNLRHATRVENSRNKSMQLNNKSGFTGVSWHERTSKWIANIIINGNQKHLGYFTDINDAIEARKKANIEHEFHENHGAIN